MDFQVAVCVDLQELAHPDRSGSTSIPAGSVRDLRVECVRTTSSVKRAGSWRSVMPNPDPLLPPFHTCARSISQSCLHTHTHTSAHTHTHTHLPKRFQAPTRRLPWCRPQVASKLCTEYNDLGGWLMAHQLPVVYSNVYNIGFMASTCGPCLAPPSSLLCIGTYFKVHASSLNTGVLRKDSLGHAIKPQMSDHIMVTWQGDDSKKSSKCAQPGISPHCMSARNATSMQAITCMPGST